jgi:hypothetical protein
MNTTLELQGVFMMLLALIESHPEPKALLAAFDALTGTVQVHNAQSGAQTLSDEYRATLQRYRGQIQLQIDKKDPTIPE